MPVTGYWLPVSVNRYCYGFIETNATKRRALGRGAIRGWTTDDPDYLSASPAAGFFFFLACLPFFFFFLSPSSSLAPSSAAISSPPLPLSPPAQPLRVMP